jgi:hypothetical protein
MFNQKVGTISGRLHGVTLQNLRSLCHQNLKPHMTPFIGTRDAVSPVQIVISVGRWAEISQLLVIPVTYCSRSAAIRLSSHNVVSVANSFQHEVSIVSKCLTLSLSLSLSYTCCFMGKNVESRPICPKMCITATQWQKFTLTRTQNTKKSRALKLPIHFSHIRNSKNVPF